MNDPWKERLSEHLDGELSPADARGLEAHLTSCAGCRERLSEMRRIVQTARALPDRLPERELWPAIEAALEPLGRARSTRRGRWRAALAVAAALVIALAALWLLRDDRASSQPKLAHYLMLLHEPAGHMANATRDEVRAVVDEYRSWAQSTAASGHLISGEKLADGAGWILRPGEKELPLDTSRGASVVGGFFMIAAAGDREAREIALTCPHLRHDGWIELRPIDDPSAPRPKQER